MPTLHSTSSENTSIWDKNIFLLDILPDISSYLIFSPNFLVRVVVETCQANQTTSLFLWPQNPALSWVTLNIPRPTERYNSSSMSWDLGLPQGLHPEGHTQNSSLVRHTCGALIGCPNHFSWLFSALPSRGSFSRSLRIYELFTLSRTMSPTTLLRNLISSTVRVTSFFWSLPTADN